LRYPRVEIDTDKLLQNARVILERCRAEGIEVTAVTKVTCAHPAVVETLTRAGLTSLGDSRLRNLRRIRKQAPDAELVLLRLPMPSQADEVVRWADVSLNSEITTLRALDAAARRAGRTHGIILMVDMGDLREGVWPDEVGAVCTAAREMSNIKVRGVGTNLACYGGVRPAAENMQGLLDCRKVASETLGHPMEIVSGGNSANWLLLEAGRMPSEINHLRIGEALFLGNESVDRTPIWGMADDVFTVCAEIIEVRVKPSLPVGELGQDAFGNVPIFEDRGLHRRAIVAVGRQDVVPEGLRPQMKGVKIIGASSDHMILDVEDAAGSVEVGDVLRFTVRGYSCLLAVFTSPYLRHVAVRDGQRGRPRSTVNR
jgi:ornithine racemase